MPQDNIAAPTTNEPRKKRAKIMSACAECRRKKTKCNGEQPCRSCQKSLANCIYPTATTSSTTLEDKKSGKLALEAIEDRLKTIEDMLKSILQQSSTVRDLDPIAVNNFLNKDHQRLPSIHNLSATLPDNTTHYHHHHHMTPNTEQHQLPPIMNNNDEYQHLYKQEHINKSLLKKRKR